MITLIEFQIFVVVIVLAIAVPTLGNGLFRRVSRAFRALAHRRAYAIASVGVFAFLIEAAIGLLAQVPVPSVHDEFAYLLTADTFASGRLTNPPHLMAEHFATHHVIQQPTYQAKYPPAQGAVMALGQLITGEPIVGVWLSAAAACAAVCWMLYGWLPPKWALLGGFLCAMHPGLTITWGQTYWGGAAAMAGGALMFGALPRIQRHQRPRDAVLLGIGLGILANSRPFEGLVASIPVALVLAVWFLRQGRIDLLTRLQRVAVPTLIVLCGVAAWMGFYNYRVTGNAMRMPYQEWLAQQSTSSSAIIWNLPHNMKRFQFTVDAQNMSVKEIARIKSYMESRRLTRPKMKLLKHYIFYYRVIFGITLLALPWVLRRRGFWLAAVTYVLVILSMVVQSTAPHPHYTAPVACLFILMVVQGLRHMRFWRFSSRPVGQFLVRATPIYCAVTLFYIITFTWPELSHSESRHWCLARAAIIERLEPTPKRHLVIVRYDDDHTRHEEWVYNAADIDNAKIVWAHDLGDEKNKTLLDYFADRRAWLLEADTKPTRVTRYPNASLPTAPPNTVADSEHSTSVDIEN